MVVACVGTPTPKWVGVRMYTGRGSDNDANIYLSLFSAVCGGVWVEAPQRQKCVVSNTVSARLPMSATRRFGVDRRLR